jgi:hypothetical protein
MGEEELEDQKLRWMGDREDNFRTLNVRGWRQRMLDRRN